jgi:hypothetical protein
MIPDIRVATTDNRVPAADRAACASDHFCVSAAEDTTVTHAFVNTCQAKCFNSNYGALSLITSNNFILK